jgi:chromosome segregation protein
MYLQSLEMIGFKSFAAKTVLNFHRGVTAVVGPNGCGKSNVLDALRWVLGEQSAKALRGGEMADVIFSGTDSRQALGMAEVSLTFAECEKDLGVEWNEVRITRRVHRDGKSEYFINKSPCRLKDIHELFMDTGVGRSAYSIMEQGKIDLILSSRPEDRRTIFEEAAGITKYKAQKKEALRKLEYTEANLLRVQDIIKEVARQIGSLQRQAAKARRYQAIVQDLRTFDTHLSHKNYLAQRTELEALHESLRRTEEARHIHEQEISAQEVDLAGFRHGISEKDEELSGLRERRQDVRNRAFAAESRINTNTERIGEGRELIERHRADIAAAEEKISVQRLQIEETDQQIARMIEALTSRKEELAAQEERVAVARSERSEMERAINEAGARVARAESRVGALRGEVTAAAGRRESSETRLRLLRGESEAVAEAVSETTIRLEDIKRRLVEAEAVIEAARAEQSAASNAHEAAQKARQEAEFSLNAASKEASAVESKLEVLRQLQEQGEGFDEGTQAILRGLHDPELFKPAILGALADHIRVEETYIPAVEAAMGGMLQSVLFKDVGVAEAAISALFENKLGRAAAIPREWIVAGEAFAGTLPGGALRWAAECIGGDGDGARLARYLLRETVVVSSLREAFALKSENPELAVVTIDGALIDRQGIIHGGRTGESPAHSALARKAQIERLEAELTAAISRLEEKSAVRAAAVEALDAAQTRLLASKESAQSAQVELSACQSELSLAQRQLSDLEARREAFARESAQLEEALRISVARLGELDAGIVAALADIEQAREQRVHAEREAQSAREREAAATDALNEVRVAVATGREQQESLARQRGPMAARLTELSEILESRSRDIDRYEVRIAELDAENTNLRESLGGLAEEETTLDADILACEAARTELRSQAGAVESALRVARGQLVSLQEEKGRLEVRGAQMEMRMENLRNHVSQRYQTDLEAFEPDTYGLMSSFRDRMKKRGPKAVPVDAGQDTDSVSPEDTAPQTDEEPSPEGPSPAIEEGIPWDAIEELVAELTERADSMGPINLEAIQEFEELEQRHLFLEKQNADLVNSKVELLEVIARINRTTKNLFSETFAKIRENFQVMFTELFGGGHANLLLVDESDPLESGIEIIAKPPGKQLKSVSLLSGGERTMTAVALLFGIYMVKPSPFCVLDEMDAPLDESNISRFIKILDRFVDQSQFVVITHNKRTISRAEMLYGVTMEEHGVSKLVSVRFSEEKPEPEVEPASVAESFGKHGNLHTHNRAMV